jgi:putative restriction endonuclease
MNSLERTLIERAGYAHGWENVRESKTERVVMFSARHKAEAHITPTEAPMIWSATFPKGPPTAELSRSLPALHHGDDTFRATDEASLGRLLRRAAELAMSLPNQAVEQYATEIAKIDANPPSATETLALVKQRIGQDFFRKALMDYWGGACSVTGIAIPELLRASHAKPWAECASDEERLNVFNGFLFCAHLDALFDRGLMTFDETGAAVFSDTIDAGTRNLLNLTVPMKLRWLATEHGAYLQWHREKVFTG